MDFRDSSPWSCTVFTNAYHFRIYVPSAMEEAIIGATECTFQGRLRRLDSLSEFLLFVVAELVLSDVATVPTAARQSDWIHLKFGGRVFQSCVFGLSSYLPSYFICHPIDLFIGDEGKVVMWLAR